MALSSRAPVRGPWALGQAALTSGSRRWTLRKVASVLWLDVSELKLCMMSAWGTLCPWSQRADDLTQCSRGPEPGADVN